MPSKPLSTTLAAGLLATVGVTATAAPCDSPAHRQFDFWLGQWQVHTPDGKLAGLNSITLEYGNCVLREHYTTQRGYAGGSFNIFDATRKVWHQTWVDNQGALIALEGGMQGSSMVLEGQNIDAKGRTVKQRISWTPNADGSVRQHWQSMDEQGQWVTAFDGRYTR